MIKQNYKLSVFKVKQKNNNSRRILQKSLELFNAHGPNIITLRDICSALDISPGNLTYHFKKKNDILHALVDQLEIEVLKALSALPDLDAKMEEHARVMKNLLTILWKYRFFFNYVIYIVNKDDSQKARYFHMRDAVIKIMLDSYSKLSARGSIKPVQLPNTAELLIENLWSLCLGNLRLYLIETPSNNISQNGYLKYASERFYSFFEPYYADSIKAGYYDFF